MVYYQPKVDTCTGKIACAEALVRWRLKDGQIIRPDQFIPVLEKNFQIARLDQYVFESICRWLKSRLDQGLRVLPVSFNVSRLQFYDVHFLDTYIGIRDRYQIPPALLEIEFTESIAFDNTQLLLKTLDSLRNAGFYVSVDDFGKGYSSLSLLKQVPIDELKLDRLFFMNGDDQMKDLSLIHIFFPPPTAETSSGSVYCPLRTSPPVQNTVSPSDPEHSWHTPAVCSELCHSP